MPEPTPEQKFVEAMRPFAKEAVKKERDVEQAKKDGFVGFGDYKWKRRLIRAACEAFADMKAAVVADPLHYQKARDTVLTRILRKVFDDDSR